MISNKTLVLAPYAQKPRRRGRVFLSCLLYSPVAQWSGSDMYAHTLACRDLLVPRTNSLIVMHVYTVSDMQVLVATIEQLIRWVTIISHKICSCYNTLHSSFFFLSTFSRWGMKSWGGGGGMRRERPQSTEKFLSHITCTRYSHSFANKCICKEIAAHNMLSFSLRTPIVFF